MDNLQPGQMLGPYRIMDPIGQGGMATVYKAYQASMDRYVAIKVLPSKLAESTEFSGRFQQEAHIIAKLEHPHILPVFDYGESNQITYLVMRYLEAGTLKKIMERGRLTLGEIDRLFVQLADALGYAHARGVIHRDLKPSNVLVDAEGNVFLTDFGIAKLLEGTTDFTQTDAIIGTPDYISPEQAQGIKVDQRSDLYSLGIMLYEMVIGRVPFKADTPLAVIMKHVSEPLPLPSRVSPDIHPAIEKVILKALEKDREQRFATAGEFAAAWKSALAQAMAAPEPTMKVAAPAPASAPLPTNQPSVTTSSKLPPVNPAAVSSKPQTKRSSTGLVVGGIAGGCLLILVLIIGGGYLLARNLFAGSEPTPTVLANNPPAGQSAPTQDTGSASSPLVVPTNPPDPSSTTAAVPTQFTITGGDHFSIMIGDEIARDQPAAGAGNLENPYAMDVYTFTAKPGQEVYFQTIKHPGNTFLTKFRLFDDIGNEIFNSCMQCGDRGLTQLERGGVYTLAVGQENDNSTGVYQIKIWDVPPPQEFSVEIGSEISRDVPGAGAGYIETPGVKDIYTFTAEPGEVIVLEFIKTPGNSTLTTWALFDELDYQIGSSCLQCGNSQPLTLDRGGEYRLVIGNKSDPGAGTYTIRIVAP
jgi:serine/threonine protein kinase